MPRKTAESKFFLMILPLFFEHFIRICVFRSFSFFLAAFFNVLPTYFFPLLRAFHICYFAYMWASKLCAMRSCMCVCAHISRIFRCLSVLLKEVLLFQIFSNKEAEREKIKFWAITRQKKNNLKTLQMTPKFSVSYVTTYRKCKKFNFRAVTHRFYRINHRTHESQKFFRFRKSNSKRVFFLRALFFFGLAAWNRVYLWMYCHHHRIYTHSAEKIYRGSFW